MNAVQSQRTRERILDGAVEAIARHGLAKLGMTDVSQTAGVSRGTLYRYFPTREELLVNLADRERRRFQQVVRQTLEEAPEEGAERVRIVLHHATRYVREHPALQRLLDTELGFVLAYLREQLPAIRAAFDRQLAPLLEEIHPVRLGLVTTDQLVDWFARMMISAVLFPDPNPEEMARGLTAVYRLLSHPADGAPKRRPAPGRSRR